jgi:hypothetical protein
MKREGFLAGMVVFLFVGLLYTSPVQARMVKEVAIGVMSDAPSQAACDWQYMRYHGPEVTLLSGPWMTRYWLWLPYEPPQDTVELFGAVRGRYAELWYREDDYLDRPSSLRGQTLPYWDKDQIPASGQTTVTVYANPSEEFYDSDPHPDRTNILRWITIIRYPENVSVEAGEEWFLETHAKEAVKQPGLLKFVSYKTLPLDEAFFSQSVMFKAAKDMPDMPQMPEIKRWVRVCEYWYEDFEAWRKAVLESPPQYTPPSWGGEYPFVEMTSTFIPFHHDVDFLKGTYQVDFDRP